MRMRKVKWAVDYLPESKVLVSQPAEYKGKWKALLNQKRIHVEIGCGKGNYSIGMANMNENEGFIAIEKNESAAGIAAKKMDEFATKGNLRLIQDDASAISEWFADGEIDVIHLNFSDPWPKKRYAKRRLSSSSFLDQYKNILSAHGEIQMKTDNSALFEYSVLEFLRAGFILEDISVDYRREQHEEDAITEYEEKFIANGQPIYRSVWKKKQEEE